MNYAYAEAIQNAKQVLETNYTGTHTVPANGGLYPHQWLWDSCFIAIGLRHYDIERAQQEILRLFDGQWHNGMVPNMILSSGAKSRDARIWQSWLNPNAPDNLQTSGITQPPMIAEAVVQIGKKLKPVERRKWYKQVYPKLLAYHQWLYDDRDPHNEGLVLQLHPWETGLDNTPPWMHQLHEHQMPVWIQLAKKVGLKKVINIFRKDTKLIPAEQRLDTYDALALYSTQRRLRRKRYNTEKALSHSLFAIEDVSYNAIFIRANQHLRTIAKDLKKELPDNFKIQTKRTEEAFEKLWDQYSSQYFSREFTSHKHIKIPSIGNLIALYSGVVDEKKAQLIVQSLENEKKYGASFPVPTTELANEWFNPVGYWQGPTWVNANWLIIDGLKRAGFKDHAEALRESTVDMVAQAGCYEYFNPKTGQGAGAENFSWTAALAIDLAHNN